MFLENTVNQKEQFGWIEVICGSMFSGKTEELIRRLNRAKIAKQKNVLIQVVHIERLNPALMALKPYYINPRFIEIQRLAPYTVRGTDVPVVLDKMIHDIDILLSVVKSDVQSLDATGLSIITSSLDIAQARIKFKNGTVASLMSSRIAQSDVRKIKLFQKNLYSTIDLLKGSTEIYKVCLLYTSDAADE